MPQSIVSVFKLVYNMGLGESFGSFMAQQTENRLSGNRAIVLGFAAGFGLAGLVAFFYPFDGPWMLLLLACVVVAASIIGSRAQNAINPVAATKADTVFALPVVA